MAKNIKDLSLIFPKDFSKFTKVDMDNIRDFYNYNILYIVVKDGIILKNSFTIIEWNKHYIKAKDLYEGIIRTYIVKAKIYTKQEQEEYNTSCKEVLILNTKNNELYALKL